MSTQMQRRIYSHATDVEIRPLDEEKAVQAAVDLIGEVFVFSVNIHFQVESLPFLLLMTMSKLKHTVDHVCAFDLLQQVLISCIFADI